MCDSKLKQEEENLQRPYDDIKIDFEKKFVLSVTVLRCRDVSVSYLRDKLDDPDPQVRVCVPDFPHPNIFTTIAKSDSPTSEINETFSFVAPTSFYTNRTPFLVQISLSDKDVLFDDDLGTKEINILNWELDLIHERTLIFGSHGEVDIELMLTLREQPDFRFGFGLCEKEREFRIRRLPIVHQNLKMLIGQDAPRDLEETPVISLCTSGGGYKAVVGASGAMEALKDAGMLDVFTYAASLSGSAWYLEAIYARQGFNGEAFDEFQDFLKKAAQEDLVSKMTSVETLSKYFTEAKKKVRLGQPVTLCDVWGFLLGETFLGENKLGLCQSEIRSYVEGGKVPYPLLVSIHVRNDLPASQFHAYMEASPYEVSFPNYGISLTPETWGSEWSRGILTRKYPEYPCHFHMGVTGSAFAVLATASRKTGEKDQDFVKFVEDEDDEMTSSQEGGIASLLEGEKTFANKLREAIVGGRESVISRTGKILNFCKNLESLQNRQLDPFGGTEFVGPEKEKLIKLFEKKAKQNVVNKKMSTKKKTISVVDAGIFNNLPVPALLRPQRSTDLMVVLDFSAEPSDEDFTNLELFATAANCWKDGLKFPPVDFSKLSSSAPAECIVFADEYDDTCPVVVWLKLSNTKFRKIENYKPQSKTTRVDSNLNLNDFVMFGPGTEYKLFNLSYDELQHDRLKELMYNVVSSNVQVIKDAIIKATNNKRRRIQRQRDNPTVKT